jgi:hypothetical protein
LKFASGATRTVARKFAECVAAGETATPEILGIIGKGASRPQAVPLHKCLYSGTRKSLFPRWLFIDGAERARFASIVIGNAFAIGGFNSGNA